MLTHLDELFPQHSFKLVQNKTNQGIGYNRQLGLTLAKGKYVVYIDSDDSIVDAYLPTLLNLIQTEKDVYCFSAITYPLGDIHNEWSYV
jgi:glycosyltransferase involved in cell wall biosynthesis